MTRALDADPRSSAADPRPVQTTAATRQKVRAVTPLLVDLLVPTVLYFVLHALGLRPVYALTVAGLATGVTAAVSSLRRRQLDGVGLLVLIEIVVSVGLLLLTSDPRVVLLKPSVYTFCAAVYLFATCIFGRPIGYEAATPLATGGDPVRLRAYHEAWDSSAPFRRRERLVTAAFGAALLLESALRVIIVFSLPAAEVGRALVVSQLPGVALIVGVLLFARSQAPALGRIVDEVQDGLAREVETGTSA